MGDAPRAEQALTLAMSTPRQDTDRWLGDYGSALRDDALKLALLEENQLLPDAQNTLLSTLAEEAYGQRWLSTRGDQCAVHGRPDITGLTRQLAGANLIAGAAAGGG